MYAYDEYDEQIVRERAAQFKDQVRRRVAGKLTEEQFVPLRLMNGLYKQRHAYMLRVAIPYGLLSSAQLRRLAHVARTYDRGYGHFTTRQNIQFNWPQLEDVPKILEELAEVEVHAIQTSGNCVRNVTTDHLAGVAPDEIEDPRPYCEIMRQWSTFHPEFTYLPRKFKIAFTGAEQDRAAVIVHDIGIRLVENDDGEVGFQVIVGGGLGRTPVLGKTVREYLPKKHLLSYTEAILRVYNRFGNRDNKFKARIKILVKTLGVDEFRRRVEEEWARIKNGTLTLTEEEIERVKGHFTPPDYRADAAEGQAGLEAKLADDPQFKLWYDHNTDDHRVDGYRVVYLSLKTPDVPPGDASADQMDAIADLAEDYSLDELRVTHEQNLVFADVEVGDLYELWQKLDELELATPNIGKLTDMICCPGLDYCALANAASIPVARQLNEKFDELDRLYDLGELKIKMSGCINACGHHHVGHIGILGIDKRGEDWYQIMLGGSAENDASLGQWLGPAIAKEDVSDAVEDLVDVYLEERDGDDEPFLETVRRIGQQPFKERVYADH